MPDSPDRPGWLDTLDATDGRLHAATHSRLAALGRESWSRRAVQAEAALAQSRAQNLTYDALLRDVLARHDELAAELEGRPAQPGRTASAAADPDLDDGAHHHSPDASSSAAEERLAEVLASPRWRIGGLLTAPVRPVVRGLRRLRARRGDTL